MGVNKWGGYKARWYIYIIYGQILFTGPDLFHNLLTDEKKVACGAMQLRKSASCELTTANFKQQGEFKVMSHNHKMIGVRLLDWKHVTLLSTAYGSDL